jgi:hypothetical protein
MSGLSVWLTGRKFPCGTRAAYVNGCRCEPCRAANRVYARRRYVAQRVWGDWNGLVSSEVARQHLVKLSRAGVGRKSVAAASDVCSSVLLEIRAGRRLKIRKKTEKKILAVDTGARADHSLVSSGKAWRRLRKLVEVEGFSKAEIARRLGYKNPSLQFGKRRMTARNAYRVDVFFRQQTEVSP